MADFSCQLICSCNSFSILLIQTKCTWKPHLLVSGRYSKDRSSNLIPCSKSYFRQTHRKVKDRAIGLGKSLFCEKISRFDGNLPLPRDSLQPTPPREICDRVKRSAYRHSRSWGTGEWVEFKDALKSSLYIMRVNQKIRRRGERKKRDITATWGSKCTMAFLRGASWNAEWSIHSFFFLKTHWVVAGACVNSAHIWQLK